MCYHHSGALCGECFDTDLLPSGAFAEPGIGLIIPYRTENTHKYITVYNSLKSLHKHSRCILESWVCIHAICVDGDDRDLRHSGLFKKR